MNNQRLDSIDAFRGLAILLMVIANFIAGVVWIPAWLKHAPDVGFTIIDLVAPMFIFAIGLTYSASVQHRLQRDGAWHMTQHFVIRYAAILGIGALFGAGEVLLQVDGQSINWGVLQAIGVAGLVTLIFIRLPAWARAIIGLALLAGYQYLLDHFWLKTVLASPHGGLYGAISWAAMLLLASVFGDLFRAGRRWHWKLALAAVVTLGVALLLTLWLPVSKNRVSAPYVLLSLGLSGLIFWGFHMMDNFLRWRMPLLVMWGRNPLLLYVLHLLLLGFVALPDIPAWYRQAPPWLVAVQGIVLLGALTTVAWVLEKQKRYVSF